MELSARFARLVNERVDYATGPRPPAPLAQRGLPAHGADHPAQYTPRSSAPCHNTAPGTHASGARGRDRHGISRCRMSARAQGTAISSSYRGSGRPIGSGGGRAGRAAGTSVGSPR